MIVLEGPDGSGKTTLLAGLKGLLPNVPVHDRASSSGPDGGPVADLFEWADRDVASWYQEQVYFYDRHPLVSEYIYGPIIRGTLDERFHTTTLRRVFAHNALTIVCLPPLGVVRASVSTERDMPGVSTHIDALWHLYASLRATWPSSSTLLVYDYTIQSVSSLVPYIHHHLNRWRYRYA